MLKVRDQKYKCQTSEVAGGFRIPHLGENNNTLLWYEIEPDIYLYLYLLYLKPREILKITEDF